MNEGIYLYFSEAEFAVMLELAEGGEYSCFLTQSQWENRQLVGAFVGLYQRGWIVQTQDMFTVSEKGTFFREIRNAHNIVLIRKQQQNPKTVVCYVQEGTLWLAEWLSSGVQKRYRLSTMRSNNVRKWLFDSGILQPPLLTDRDAEKLMKLFEEEGEREIPQDTMVQLTKYSGDGKILSSYTLFSNKVGLFLKRQDEKNSEDRFYTVDVLNQMIRECFGG